ncbi:MAG: peptide chain release factor N(5)-glutamine methyltransferase [Bacteroidota bacterium]
MTSFDALKELIEQLLAIYPAGEAVSIAKIVMEDAFGIHGFDKNQNFNAEKVARFEDILTRLVSHEPVQYVLGQADFYRMKFKVNRNVLIPRQETEEMVAWVIETAKGWEPATGKEQAAVRRILDVGTGSGCIPIAIKKKMPHLEVHSLDVSAAALEVAKGNAALNGVEVHFHQVDILDKKDWKPLPQFDLIVSNPPYIMEKEKSLLAKNVIDYEPHLALFTGNNDSQKFVKKIAAFARLHLNPGGYLFFETNEFYAPKTRKILEANGFGDIELREDLNERDRMIRGRLN